MVLQRDGNALIIKHVLTNNYKKMKNLFLTTSLLISVCATAQVAIGKSSVSSTLVSLEFGNENRGIVLPWVDGTSDIAPYLLGSPTTEIVDNGTLVYDVSDKKVKLKKATGWKDLSIDNTGTTVDPLTLVDGLTLQNTLYDKTDAKVMIGGNPSTDVTPGILVLADSDKAMVLPKVASPHLNIIDPAPGMVVYDTVKKQLAVYNGTVWTFWKP